MSSKHHSPKAQRLDATGPPKRLADVLERKARAAQQMRATMAPPKRLPGHGHRVHGR